ncbi:MAG: aminotransferase class I/II-fold pyridoxal phosphate-dependent enzyme, partial [Verrucomicrobiota bacterium]
MGCQRLRAGRFCRRLGRHLGPSWPNHKQIIDDLGLTLVPFDHANADGTANLAAVLDAIRSSQPGDGVLLHGCCHNP